MTNSREISAARTTMRHAMLLRVALPLLALSAAYGVYAFQMIFVPPIVAILSAAAFELVYLGLAFAPGIDPVRARVVALGAVVVSAVYNSLAAVWHIAPELVPRQLADVSSVAALAALGLLHGVPLALVGYSVARLLHAPSQSDAGMQHECDTVQQSATLTEWSDAELARELYARAGSVRAVQRLISSLPQ